MEGIAYTRHCAYCLQLCGYPVKLCAGCKKRAYCSKECQVKDWSSKGDGQRHVKWCRRHECGEEDVDWEVVAIPNKGLGIRAKKLIPAGFKVIVEPVFTSPNAHSGIEDLEPEGKSLEEKLRSNFFFGVNVSSAVPGKTAPLPCALRIARVHHACQPNAAGIYDETARVAILFAVKDIQPGEEISTSYYYCFFVLMSDLNVPSINPEWSLEEEFLSFKNDVVLAKYGVYCPSGFVCYDPAFLALVKEGRKLRETVIDLAHVGKTEESLAAGEKLLKIHRRLNITWIYRGIEEYTLFRLAIARPETLPRAKKYIQSAVETFRQICPYSEKYTKKYEKLLEHPETHPHYMLWA